MIKRSLSNLNPDKTKQLLSNLNLEEGIGLNDRCWIWMLMRLNGCAKSESQRRHRIKWSLPNLNPNETKWSLSNLNLEKGIWLNGHCKIWIPMRLMVIVESKSRRRHRIKWSLLSLNFDETKLFLLNMNPDETKLSLPNLNLDIGIGLNGRCQIWIPMRLNSHSWIWISKKA